MPFGFFFLGGYSRAYGSVEGGEEMVWLVGMLVGTSGWLGRARALREGFCVLGEGRCGRVDG